MKEIISMDGKSVDKEELMDGQFIKQASKQASKQAGILGLIV